MTPSNSQDGARAHSEGSARGSGPLPPGGAGRREIWNELDQSSIMSVELIAAILTWGGVGWLLDRWLGTAPWLLGFGVMLGFAAGLYLIWLRSAKDQQYANGAAAAQRRNDAPPRTDQESNGP